MTIVTQGFGGAGVIVTYGYGDLLIKILLFPSSDFLIGAKFVKLNSKKIIFEKINSVTSSIERIIAEISNDIVINPPSSDLQVIPTVFATFGDVNKIRTKFDLIDVINISFDKIIAETSNDLVVNPPSSDLQVIPTISISFEKINSIVAKQEILNKINTEFIRIIAEEN